MNDILSVRVFEKECEYICLIGPEVPSRRIGEVGRLRQVLTNLIGNAIKFTRQGEVILFVKQREEEERCTRLRFVVKDNSIPAGKIETIFAAFTRENDSTARKSCGTGFTLSITRQLIERMNDNIHVESEEGRGFTFWFSIRFEKQMSSDFQKSPTGSQSSHDILIPGLEAREINHKVIVGMAAKWGCRLEEVGESATALDGLETIRMIRDPDSNGHHQAVPIMAVTAPGSGGDREKCFQGGVNNSLAKTIQPEKVEEMVGKWLGGGKEKSEVIVREEMGREELIFNNRTLQERNSGDEESLSGIIPESVQEVPESLHLWKRAIRQRDAARIQRHAYPISGSAGNIGVLEIQQRAFRLEQMGKNSDQSNCEAAFQQLIESDEILKQMVTDEKEACVESTNC